jgi:MFS family permease
MLPRVQRVKNHIASSLVAFRDIMRNEDLRRLEVAWAAWIIAHWAYFITVSVYAYQKGGDAAVGLIILLCLVPAGLLAPFAGLLGDRYRRERVLLAVSVARTAFMAAIAACVLLDVTAVVVYVLAIAAAIAGGPFRPAQAALTPSLARSPTELTAANAVASTVESLAAFVAPAFAGLLIAVANVGTVFVVTTALVAFAALFVTRLRTEPPRRAGEVRAETVASEALKGFRLVALDPSLRVLIGLFTAQTFVAGALEVYIVVSAFELLDLGSSGVGWLNSAIGVGAILGGVLALGLTGTRRLSIPFMLGVVLWGAPLILLGLLPEVTIAVIALALIGAGNSLVDVACFTLVQRAVPDEALARVFGVIQMLWLTSFGVGAIVAPALIGALGAEEALIATGAALPALVLLLGRRVARIDATAPPPDADELRILTSVPIFSPLPGAALEHLAGRLVPLRLEPGSVVVREGDPGDRFYIVAEGTVEVSEYGRTISELGAGGYFGEIALIRDVPRTATVTAKTDTVLYALDRDEFLAAVTSHQPSAEAAEEVVSARLAGIPIAGARIPTV